MTRLLVITKTHVVVYEGRRSIATYVIDGPITLADLEAVRTLKEKA